LCEKFTNLCNVEALPQEADKFITKFEVVIECVTLIVEFNQVRLGELVPKPT